MFKNTFSFLIGESFIFLKWTKTPTLIFLKLAQYALNATTGYVKRRIYARNVDLYSDQNVPAS